MFVAKLDRAETGTKSAVNPAEGFLEFLRAENVLDGPSIQRARTAMATTSQPVDVVLLELGLTPETQLADALAQFLDLPRIDSSSFPLELPAADRMPRDFLKRAGLLPVETHGNRLTIATARPLEPDQAYALGYLLDLDVALAVAVASDLNRHLTELLAAEQDPSTPSDFEAGAAGAIESDVERLKDRAREAPVIRLLNRLVASAAERKASDIHIEALADQVRVRFRIDGALQMAETLDRGLLQGLVSRVKILAHLNIAEQRLPQDGRIRLPVRGRDIDFRVSTVPALHGESVVLRILDRQELPLNFAALGFPETAAERLVRMIDAHNGIVLVTGPTGSGKTTTLYAALQLLNRPDVKLFTVEDPIEYQLPGINQLHVRPQIGLDFAAVLRSVLRQDPDIIMVGEIRDIETARMAVQASLTGHLVLSTLHTNSAAASITRLRNMGIEEFLLVSSLRGIIAQRLVRKLCGNCKQTYDPPREMLQRLGFKIASGEEPNFKSAAGCPACHGTGYRGRTVIHEIVEMTDSVRQAVLRQAPDEEIAGLAMPDGRSSLLAAGLSRAAAGETSIEEVLRHAGTIVQ